MLKYSIDLDLEPELVIGEEFEHESLNLEEIEALKAQIKFLRKGSKKIHKAKERLVPIRVPRKQPRLSFDPTFKNPFWKLVEEVHKIQDQYLKHKELVQEACGALGNNWLEKMVMALERLPQQKIVEELEAKVNYLLVETWKLKGKLKRKKEEASFPCGKLMSPSRSSRRFKSTLEIWVML